MVSEQQADADNTAATCSNSAVMYISIEVKMTVASTATHYNTQSLSYDRRISAIA